MNSINKNDIDWMVTKPCVLCKHNLVIRVDEKKCIHCREGIPLPFRLYEGFTINEEEDQREWWQRFKNMEEQHEFDTRKEAEAPRDAFDKIGEVRPEYIQSSPPIVQEEKTS